MQGHSATLAALGAGILWYGWYGFNSGSTKALLGINYIVAGRIAVITTLCAASGGTFVMIFNRIETGKYEMIMLLNGILSGLVASTAGCAVVQPWAAIPIGGILIRFRLYH